MEWTNRSAYMFIKCAPTKADWLWKRFTDWPHAIGAWLVTGDFDLLVWYDAKNQEEMKQRVSEVRDWEGIEWTSSHFVHQGHKNGAWWWEQPAGAWILGRDKGWQSNWKSWTEWNGVVSTTSIPGPWDYLAWVGGKDWDEAFSRVVEANNKGWETTTLVPVKTWWNKTWEKQWWGNA